jgi:hypothetical protein
VAALLASAAAYLTIVGVQSHVTPDVSAAMYLAWSVPLAVALSVRLFTPAAFAQVVRPVLAVAARQLPGLAPVLRESAPGPSALAR